MERPNIMLDGYGCDINHKTEALCPGMCTPCRNCVTHLRREYNGIGIYQGIVRSEIYYHPDQFLLHVIGLCLY